MIKKKPYSVPIFYNLIARQCYNSVIKGCPLFTPLFFFYSTFKTEMSFTKRKLTHIFIYIRPNYNQYLHLIKIDLLTNFIENK